MMKIVHKDANGTVQNEFVVHSGKDAEYTLVGLILGRDIDLRPGDSITIEESEIC